MTEGFFFPNGGEMSCYIEHLFTLSFSSARQQGEERVEEDTSFFEDTLRYFLLLHTLLHPKLSHNNNFHPQTGFNQNGHFPLLYCSLSPR